LLAFVHFVEDSIAEIMCRLARIAAAAAAA